MAKPVIMPKFGFTQEEGTIVQWLVSEGDYVEKGDPVCEVTTDKVNMEVEAPASGYLGGLRFQVEDVVPVTEVIGYILDKGEQPPPAEEATGVEEPGPPRPAAREPSKGGLNVTPVARRAAESHGVELRDLEGTGPGGQITRHDVERHLASLAEGARSPAREKPRATPAARRIARVHGLELANIKGSGPGGRVQEIDALAVAQASVPGEAAGISVAREIPLEGMRLTIARRMQKSAQEAPHIDLTVDIDMTRAIAVSERAKEGSHVTVTAVIVKATAWALSRHPKFNGYFRDDRILEVSQINVGVAVAIAEGLVVPVVREVDKKDLDQIGSEIDRLADRARKGGLKPQDVADGTFTVSNLGKFGVDQFKAIINPPQIGILAVGQIGRRFVPDEHDDPVVRPLMTVTLSADHRAVDGVEAARFLGSLREALEEPGLMLI